MTSEITITSNGYAYSFDPTDPEDLRDVLRRQYANGYDTAVIDYDDSIAYENGYEQGLADAEPNHEVVHALISDFIFQIGIGTTLADKTTVEVLEELAKQIDGLE